MPANELKPKACLHFAIACWRAWAPGVETDAGWPAWLAGQRDAAAADAVPAVKFLPPLLRRRLDRVGRMALATAWPCSEGHAEVDLVFGSRHGSLERLVHLLDEVAHGALPSVKIFSMSVHNAIPGLFSIARHNHRRATAVAAGEDTLAMTLLDGASIVAADAIPALVTYVDDRPPAIYGELLPPVRTHPFSVSLLLRPTAPGEHGVRLVPAAPAAPGERPESALLQFLLGARASVTLGAQTGWCLDRDRG